MDPRRLRLGAFLAAACSLFSLAPAEGAAYDVVSRSRGVVAAQALGKVGDSLALSTASGPVSLPLSDVDFYETFRKNLGREGGRILAFQSGSLMRFESLAFEGGLATLGLGAGLSFTIPESLVDFEATVIEGAMARGLRGSVRAPVAPSRGPGGDDGAVIEPAAMADEAASLPVNAAAARRMGRPGVGPPGAPRRPFPAPGSVAEALAQQQGSEEDAGAMDQPPPTPEDLGGDEATDGGDESPTSPERSPRFRERQDQSPTLGTVVLVATTTYEGGDIQGMRVVIRYPANCTVVNPVTFSGFAERMTAVPNTNNPLRIAGIMPTIGDTLNGPGEFLRVAFSYRGDAPRTEDFALLSATAADAASANIAAFRADLALQ